MTDIQSVGVPIMSGFCNFPASASPESSHEMCPTGALTSATGVWHPCPCTCHLGEEFECECGEPLFEALNLPLDEDGDEPYAHVRDGRADYSGCRS